MALEPPPATKTLRELPTGRIVAEARQTPARSPTGSARLIVADPPWDLHGVGIFAACASSERLAIEAIAAILADGRRALKRGAHLYIFATAGPEIVRGVTALEQYMTLRLDARGQPSRAPANSARGSRNSPAPPSTPSFRLRRQD